MEKIVYNVTFYFKIHEQHKKKVFLDLVRINLDIGFFLIKNTKNMMFKYVKNAWIKN
jgi:hypothetical protein